MGSKSAERENNSLDFDELLKNSQSSEKKRSEIMNRLVSDKFLRSSFLQFLSKKEKELDNLRTRALGIEKRSLPEVHPDFSPTSHPAGGLSEEELAVLQSGGYEVERVVSSERGPLRRTAQKYQALIDTALSSKEAAKRLHIDISQVRRRLRSPSSLYGFKDGDGEWVLPAFQFAAKGALPGIGKVFRVMDPGIHPVAVLNWFITENTDLFIDEKSEEPVSPIDWLAAGYSPARVAKLAAMV